MMRSLLQDRLKLSVHRETKEIPTYNLTVVSGGPRLTPAKEGGCFHFDVDNAERPQGLHICGILIRSVNPAIAPASFYGATITDL